MLHTPCLFGQFIVCFECFSLLHTIMFFDTKEAAQSEKKRAHLGGTFCVLGPKNSQEGPFRVLEGVQRLKPSEPSHTLAGDTIVSGPSLSLSSTRVGCIIVTEIAGGNTIILKTLRKNVDKKFQRFHLGQNGCDLDILTKKRKLHWVSGFLRNRRLFKLFETTLTGSFERRRILSVKCKVRVGLLSKKWQVYHSTERQYPSVVGAHYRWEIQDHCCLRTNQKRDLDVRSTLNDQAPPPYLSDLLLKKLWSSRSRSQRWRNNLRASLRGSWLTSCSM